MEPSISMRCRITASFLASATFAFRMPARLASFAAQLFKAPAFDWRCQDDMGSLVKRRTHALVSDLGNPSRDIDLPGLIFLRRHAETRANLFEDENRAGLSMAAT